MIAVAQQERHPGLEEIFRGVAEQLRSPESVQQTYDAIARAAVQAIEGCDHAGVATMPKGEFTTASATDEVVAVVDRLQAETGEGPCLDAIVEEAWEHYPDITQGSRWSQFTRRVVEETPVRSMLAFRLVDDGRKHGALNLYSDRPHAFDDRSTDVAAILASFASVAVAAAEEREQAEQMRAGLASNREIGKAVGLLMAARSVSADDAFQVLVHASQSLNRKLRDVAGDVVRNHERRTAEDAAD